MPGETSRSPVLGRLQPYGGEWVTHATVGARKVAGRTTIAFELSYTRFGTSDRCST